MSAKPIVSFVNTPDFIKVSVTNPDIIASNKKYLDENNEFEYAMVSALNHPIIGRDRIRTSIVLKKNLDGSFETLNTLYVPLEK